MASIRKHGPSWQIRFVQPDGSAGSRSGFTTRRAAEAVAREIEDTVASGRRWEPRDARASANLREVAAAYVTDCARRLRPITVLGYARSIETFLTWLATSEPALPGSALSRPVLLAYFDHLTTTPATAGGHDLARRRSASTPVKRLAELHTWWEWAYDAEERWPGTISPPKELRLSTPPPVRVVAPTWAEMDACIASALGPQRRAAIVMRYTGLRVGQVMRLKWSDLDLVARELRVRPELGKSRAESAGRTIPVSAHLVSELAGWGVREGWLIPTHRRDGPRERVFRSRDLGRAWQRAGVRPEVWKGRPDHAFRKGFRSGLKRAGADTEALEYLLGHQLGSGEEGTYTDPDALPLREAVDLVPAVAEPAPRASEGSMATGWPRVGSIATPPEGKRRLRAVPRGAGFADGGTRTPTMLLTSS